MSHFRFVEHHSKIYVGAYQFTKRLQLLRVLIVPHTPGRLLCKSYIRHSTREAATGDGVSGVNGNYFRWRLLPVLAV